MPELLNIEVQLEPRVRNISVDVESQLQDIEVGICSSFIYAFSPTAKVEKIENGNYLITITDKNGTTTAEVPVVDQETIDGYIEYYLEHNPIIIQQLIKEAEDYQELYTELKQLIQNAIDVSVPAEPDGSININGTNYQVYELPEEVVTTDDFLIIDCLDAGAETSSDPGDSIPQQTTDKTGNGIDNVIFNDDYTLTIIFTDGTSYKTPPIRGAKGDPGTGIASTILNNNYTLTISFTDGSSYTTPSIRGAIGAKGDAAYAYYMTVTPDILVRKADGTLFTNKVKMLGQRKIGSGTTNFYSAYYKVDYSVDGITWRTIGSTLMSVAEYTVTIPNEANYVRCLMGDKKLQDSTYGVASKIVPVISDGETSDVSDVQVNGISIVSQGVASIPVASPSTYGVIKGGCMSISGTTPSITAQDGVQYICGEVTTLDITLPDSGIVDVVFTSGATATVLTVTSPTGQTVRWANGFDPTALETDTIYEINILNGLGVVGSWTQQN